MRGGREERRGEENEIGMGMDRKGREEEMREKEGEERSRGGRRGEDRRGTFQEEMK